MTTSPQFYLALIVLLNYLSLTFTTDANASTWMTTFRRQRMEAVCKRQILATEKAPQVTSSCADEMLHDMNSITTSSNGKQAKKLDELHVIGLFGMTGVYPAGMSYLPAALLAVKHINSNSSLLSGYNLQINSYDTRGREPWALNAIYTEVYSRRPPPIMVLGSTCSHVTEATAPVSYLYGMCQISYSAVSPHLSNKQKFPSFFRVMTPEQNLTVARVKLLTAMNWSRVHVIYQNYKLFSTLAEMLRQDLEQNNISVVGSAMFTDDPYEAVRELKAIDARIIIGNFYGDKARLVMCAAFQLDKTGEWYKKLVWVLPSFLDRRWMDHKESLKNCTPANIRQVAGSYFSVGSQSVVDKKGYKPVGYFPRGPGSRLYKVKDVIPCKFDKLYRDSGCHRNTSSSANCLLHAQHRAAEAYDAVWAIALALNNTLTYLDGNQNLNDFAFGCRDGRFPDIIRRQLQSVQFNALSGPFAFNALRERTLPVEINRYINEDEKTVRIGKCTYFENSEQWNCFLDADSVIWNTVDGKPPLDGIQTKCRTLEIDFRIKMVFSFLSAFGILVSVALLIFNIKQRNHVILKRSSPVFNNLILIASILAYATILIKRDISDESAITFCMVPDVTIVFSFSLGFGTLFVKNWRLYQIFTAGAKVLNRKMLKDASLSLFIIALLLVNSTLVLSWFVISPETTKLVNISRTPPVEGFDIEYVNQIKRCSSKYGMHFEVALMAVQGMIMLFGTFLAIQIRKIPKIHTKLMGSTYSTRFAWCIFNLMILAPVTVIVVFATRDEPEINYVLEATMIIIITSMSLTLIFVPKITSFCRYKYWYTKTKMFKKQQKFILSSRDVFSPTSCDKRRAQDEMDHNQMGQNDPCAWSQQQASHSSAGMSSRDVSQQTDIFRVMTDAASTTTSSIPEGTNVNDSSAQTSPSQCELDIGFPLCNNCQCKRSNSESFLRRLSLESFGFPIRKAFTGKRMCVSSSNLMIEVKTDMNVKSRMTCQRSRSEKKHDSMKMARIKDLLTDVREGDHDCPNINL